MPPVACTEASALAELHSSQPWRAAVQPERSGFEVQVATQQGKYLAKVLKDEPRILHPGPTGLIVTGVSLCLVTVHALYQAATHSLTSTPQQYANLFHRMHSIVHLQSGISMLAKVAAGLFDMTGGDTVSFACRLSGPCSPFQICTSGQPGLHWG